MMTTALQKPYEVSEKLSAEEQDALAEAMVAYLADTDEQPGPTSGRLSQLIAEARKEQQNGSTIDADEFFK